MEIVTYICTVIVGIFAVICAFVLIQFFVLIWNAGLEWVNDQILYWRITRNDKPKSAQRTSLFIRIVNVYVVIVAIFCIILGVLFFHYIGSLLSNY